MDYLHQKQLLLVKILENTQAQTSAIEDDQLEHLDVLIAQRESLMKQVDELDQKETTMTPEISNEPTGSIKDLLNRIILIDNANQSLMKEALSNVKTELRKIRTGRQQGEHYGVEYGDYREEGIFFDTKE